VAVIYNYTATPVFVGLEFITNVYDLQLKGIKLFRILTMYYIFIEVHSFEYGVLWGLQLFMIHSCALTERFDKFFH
jgi:hypothetical protein